MAAPVSGSEGTAAGSGEHVRVAPGGVRWDPEAVSRVAQDYDLDLVVLFGSRAKGRSIRGSDIDVAVRRRHGLPRPVTPEDVDRELALMGELVSAIWAEDGDIDVVFLNGQSPLLLFEVARAGIPLYEATPLAFFHFRSYAARLYDTNRKFFQARRDYLRREFLGSR